MLDLEIVDALPAVRRGRGEPSEEQVQLQEALKSGKPNVLRGIEQGNPYNSLQQRIRGAAKKLGVKVSVIQQKTDDGKCDVYFAQKVETAEATATPKKSTKTAKVAK